VRGEFSDLVFVGIERVTGDVEAEELFFALEFFARGPVVGFGERGLGMIGGKEAAEEGGLAVFFVAGGADAGFDGSIEGEEELRACAVESVERTGFDEAFHDAPVDGLHVGVFRRGDRGT